MTMPNFLVIGAGKSGTTSLYHYLKQHPEVYMSPVKEPNFFAFDGRKPDYRGPGNRRRISRGTVTDIEGYRALFAGVSGEKAVGEASPRYLYVPEAAGRIKHYVPEARLIAILRDPAERAYSHFLMARRNCRDEPLADFVRALEAEEGRIKDNWWMGHYKRRGLYHAQLTRYYELFGRERIRVYLYEDLAKDPLGMLRDMFGFLGVDDSFVPDVSLRYNKSGFPRSVTLYKVLQRPHPIKSVLKHLLPKEFRQRLRMRLRNKVLVKPPFPEEVRRELKEAYREDILKLQILIGRDLSGWLR